MRSRRSVALPNRRATPKNLTTGSIRKTACQCRARGAPRSQAPLDHSKFAHEHLLAPTISGRTFSTAQLCCIGCIGGWLTLTCVTILPTAVGTPRRSSISSLTIAFSIDSTSTTESVGHPTLVAMARYGREFFARCEEHTGSTADFVQSGYLLVGPDAAAPEIRAGRGLQVAAGVRSVLMTRTRSAPSSHGWI